MAKYIDREALEKAMTVAAVNGKDKDRRTWAKAICVLHDIPTVDLVPVVHGRWEYIPQTLNTLSQFRCPFCRWWSLDPSIDGAYNYCPNCGAKMDEKEATYD